MSGGPWYIQQYGKVTGPFSWEQLRTMKAQGQLGSFAQLSQDKLNWVDAVQFFPPPPPLPKPKPKPAPAPGAENKTTEPLATGPGHGKTMMGQPADLPLEPFPDSLPMPNPAAAQARPQHAAPSGGGSWHYAIDEQTYGPVSFEQLQEMVARGDLHSGDMVWEQDSLEGWLPVSSIPELGGKPNPLIWIIPVGCLVLLLFAIGVISLIVFLVNKK